MNLREQAIQRSLGRSVGDPEFDSRADLNEDGVVNAIDVARWRLTDAMLRSEEVSSPEETTRLLPESTDQFGDPEIISVAPRVVNAIPCETTSFLFVLRNNVTPLVAYSLDIAISPMPGSTGEVAVDVGATNFYDKRNLITAGGAARDPVFSQIVDLGDGTVFVNTITADNSTVSAVDGINDVLAEVVVAISSDASGDFRVQLGQASSLTDGSALAVGFAFTEGTISVEGQIVPPRITLQPTDVTTCEGGSASLSVAACGTAPLTITWFEGGAEIADAMEPRLEINPVLRDDAGIYHVTVTNAVGSATSSSALLDVILADADCDGLVGLNDIPPFIACMLGPGGGLADGCRTFDLTDNRDVDLHDLALFQTVFTGD